MRVQRTCTKQLRAPLIYSTTLGHQTSTQYNFNSCSFNYLLDYSTEHTPWLHVEFCFEMLNAVF